MLKQVTLAGPCLAVSSLQLSIVAGHRAAGPFLAEEESRVEGPGSGQLLWTWAGHRWGGQDGWVGEDTAAGGAWRLLWVTVYPALATRSPSEKPGRY